MKSSGTECLAAGSEKGVGFANGLGTGDESARGVHERIIVINGR